MRNFLPLIQDSKLLFWLFLHLAHISKTIKKNSGSFFCWDWSKKPKTSSHAKNYLCLFVYKNCLNTFRICFMRTFLNKNLQRDRNRKKILTKASSLCELMWLFSFVKNLWTHIIVQHFSLICVSIWLFHLFLTISIQLWK